MMVGEISEHCDDYGRLMQHRGGEAREQSQRTRRHLHRMESSPTREVRPRQGGSAASREGSRAMTGHEVDRAGGTGGGGNPVPREMTAVESGEAKVSGMMKRRATWRKRSHRNSTPAHLTTSIRRLTPPDRATSSTSRGVEVAEDEIGANETHDESEAYHRLRCCMGVAEEGEPTPRASGFSTRRGDEHLIARLGQCHATEGADEHADDREGGDVAAMMQTATSRRRAGERGSASTSMGTRENHPI